MLFYGQKELAYEWLTKALNQGYTDMGYLRSDPALNSNPGGKRLSIVFIETVRSLEPQNHVSLGISAYFRSYFDRSKKVLTCGIGKVDATVLKFYQSACCHKRCQSGTEMIFIGNASL